MALQRDEAGRIRVWDVALEEYVMTQPVDARFGIADGTFLPEKPQKASKAPEPTARRGGSSAKSED